MSARRLKSISDSASEKNVARKQRQLDLDFSLPVNPDMLCQGEVMANAHVKKLVSEQLFLSAFGVQQMPFTGSGQSRRRCRPQFGRSQIALIPKISIHFDFP